MDGTRSDGLGRLVNDAAPKFCNSKMKKIQILGTPSLALFATKDNAIGEELRYDYGVKDLPWRNNTGK